MKTSRRLLVVLAGACVFILSTVATAGAQTPVDPSTTPVENNGGWVFSMAQLLTLIGVVTVLFLIVMYMRYAPRFAKDEEGLKVVRADRVRPGHALPRRDVDISQAAPVVVAVEDTFLSIKSDDPVTPDRFITVRGSSRTAGAVARAVVTPRVRFGATLVGRQRDLSVVIENVGDVPLRVNGVGLMGAVPGLTVDANPPRPIALAPGARTQLDLHYAPAAVAAQGFRESLFLDIEDAGGQVIETRFVPVRGSAHSAATDLLTSLLAALGLADLPPDEAIA